MLEKIIAFSIRNKLIVGIMVLALIGWGSYSVSRLPIDALPDITNNQVQIITIAPTLAAPEVERSITFPIEMAVANVPDLVEIRSISRFGLSTITVVFNDKVDTYLTRQLISERLQLAQEELPPDASPELAPVTTGLGEIYQYVLHTKPGYDTMYNATDLRTMQDWIVRRQLLGTPGVADISSLGGFLKQYEVAINPQRLHSLGISISDIFKALEQNNENTGGAYIDKKPNLYFIRGIGLVENKKDIEQIVVKNTPNGNPVLIRDVAEVQLGHAPRYGAMTRNTDGEVVGGIVMMLKGANSNEVIKNVQARIDNIQKSLPEGVVIEPFLDRSSLVKRAINTVTKNLVEGALIVVFVLVLLLGNLRAGLLVASVIPLSMLFAFGMMDVFGVSGNLMSLGALDFGLIVDGAVIIVEGVVHRIAVQSNLLPPRLNQKQMDEEVFTSSSHIMKSATFGMLIILIVYLPILALTGIEGKMFKPMAETVSFAIIGALILSLTYVPMMATLVLSKKTTHKLNFSDKIIAFVHRFYKPVISWALHHKTVVVGSAVVVLAASFWLFSRLGGEFIPSLDEGDFALEVRMMPGISLSQSIETSTKVSEILLRDFPEVKETIGKIGSSEIPTDPMPIEANDFMVILKDKDEWTSASSKDELAAKMNESLQAMPGVIFGFQQPIQLRFNELMTGARQDVAIKIFGEDLEELSLAAQQTAQLIAGINGMQDVYVEEVTGLPQIQVRYNRAKIAQYGLTIQDVNNVLRAAFAGEAAGVVFENEKRFDLVVRMNQDFRQNLQDVQDLFIPLPTGEQIPLAQVATVAIEEGPMQISREDAKRRIVVGFNVRNRDIESVVGEVQPLLDQQLKLPPGYYITYGGQFENLVEARSRLMIAVPVALLLIFTLLFFAFRSFKQSLLIFTAIPFAAIGGILALWLRDLPFSISAGVGFIALFGVAVLNGIVLIGYFNQLAKEGITDVYGRVMKGTDARLRPVLMTALVASLGFLPMALAQTAGAEVQRPLATVVIGGLVTATILTLVVLPVLYTIFTKNDEKTPPAGTASAAAVIVLLALFFLPQKSIAQTAEPITLDAAVTEALQNNLQIKQAKLQTEQQKQLKGTAWNIPKTEFGLMYGQYNSDVKDDNQITVTQNFDFPGVYVRQRQLAQAEVISAQQQEKLTGQEVKRLVRLAWYNLAYQEALEKRLEEQVAVYDTFVRAAELRVKTGETYLLEQTTAQAQNQLLQNRLRQNLADQSIFQQQLQVLLLREQPVKPATDTLLPRELPQALQSENLNQNPYIEFLKAELEKQRKNAQVEKAKVLPDFSVGYFNQTLIGTQATDNKNVTFNSSDRFTGFMAGVSLPLWYKPHTARVQAAKVQTQIAETQLELAQKQLQSQLQQLLQQYQKTQNSLEFYQQTGLPQARQIIKHAELNYRNGNIGYVEFVQALQQAFLLQTGYLQTLQEYNEIVIELEFIVGE